MKDRHSIEQIHHFRCGACGKWWSIADAPPARKKWFCPWCGKAVNKGKQSRKR